VADAPRPKASVRIERWDAGRRRRVADTLAVEEPLEIRINTASFTVTLRTPGHDDELAAGLLFTEGIVRSRGDLLAFRPHPRNREGNVLDVFLAEPANAAPKPQRRLAATSSCGLCGAASLAALRRTLPRPAAAFSMTPETLLDLPVRLRTAQAAFDLTGGLHAAGLFTPDGHLLFAREDIGRHNAVDKVVGRAFLDGLLPLDHHVLVVSGRTSVEIIRKALAAGLGFVAAVSAPSNLAVALARSKGMTLAGFLREQRFNVYTGGRRIRQA
jgi:FdhD protein